ncbi:MAG: UPF0182 family protein, partial [Spirochaetaceae bacterium]|nr:UPF0182 family protein [Spirochaetaceae bacterium]
MSYDMPGAAGPTRSVPPSRRRSRALLPTLVILGALLIGFSIVTGFYTDLLWFRSVGATSVFTRTLGAKALLFVLFGLLFAAVVAVNFVVAYRFRPTYQAMIPGQQELDRYRMAIDPYKRVVVAAIVTLLGLIAGSTAAGEWRMYMQWRNGVSFGQKDAQFGKDISFFAFELPWWRFVLGFAIATVVVGLIAAAVTHYLYGGLRLQALLGERATPAARVHLSVLLGTFVLLRAVGYWLDRYGLAVDEHRIGRADFTGLTYTDVNAVLQGKLILSIISVMCAALFFANVVRRTWLLPGIGVGLLVLSALLVGGIYPALVQRFQVAPAEPDQEEPYIKRNIAATRAAYGIDKVQIDRYDAATTASGEQLRADVATTANIRLLDPSLLSSTFKNLQQFRPYYDFPTQLDVDRYTIGGEPEDVIVAVREVSLTGLPAAQRNWINDRTVYTHGFGFVAARGDRTDGGRPQFVSSDIPPQGEITGFEPRIYFGQESPSYSIVGGSGETARELDFPDDSSAAGVRNTTYKGEGGVPISSLWHKLLFATKYQEANILLSDRISEGSKILYTRDPKERVEKVAPWLTLDGDPYPAVVDGKIQWIVDGYTTSNGYPYSTRSTLDDVTADSRTTTSTALVTPVERVNYIRNSVKATVDAYDGTVTLYEWDEQDPVLKTWRKAFPGVVKDRAEISAELEDHIRYPEDLFKVQRTLLANYHVSDPQAFYNGSNFWRVPVDPTQPVGGTKLQPPYYLTLKMPGQSERAFSLTSTFVPTGDRNNLAAFVAVNADPGPDYGTFRVLELPSSLQINGPSQVQNQLESEDTIAEEINILKRGTRVRYGNLLTLPVGGGLLYVEPVYVQSDASTSFPLLRKVLVSFGNDVAFEDTLEEALDALFADQGGVSGGAPTPDPTGEPTEPGGPDQNAALTRALADAQDAIKAAEGAFAAGDFAAYGAAQDDLRDAIDRAVRAKGSGGTTTSPSPSPSP